MLSGAGFLTTIFLIPAHAILMNISVEHIGLLMGLANGCTVLGSILLHHYVKAHGHLNGMLLIHTVAFLSVILIWFNASNYNHLSLFTVVFSMSAGSINPMYPLGKIDTKDKESWLVGGTLVMKWMVLTTAVAIPILKVFYFDWAKMYLTQHWVKPGILLVSSGYYMSAIGLMILRFSLSPHLKAKV